MLQPRRMAQTRVYRALKASQALPEAGLVALMAVTDLDTGAVLRRFRHSQALRHKRTGAR